MTPRSFFLTQDVQDYIAAHGSPRADLDRRLEEETGRRFGDRAGMQISREQSALLTMLTRLVDAHLAIEVGTFTGMSALAIARGLADGGRLVCCDISEEWTSVGRRFWAEGGVADRIDLRIGPALQTLGSLPTDQPVDLAFVDADKVGYVGYWEELVPRLRPGGLMVVDNVLWGGAVVDPKREDVDTLAIRRFNEHAAADIRMETVMLAVGDGVTVARRSR